eukprot:Phypoly_transcript_26308.p1 GENE.Phypoly_transcript_26308~~Phypoly_transcript_26308.p1  ORF type:complete len:104 (+),score=11.25 Phypoly_transcript_26308:64-375(+)
MPNINCCDGYTCSGAPDFLARIQYAFYGGMTSVCVKNVIAVDWGFSLNDPTFDVWVTDNLYPVQTGLDLSPKTLVIQYTDGTMDAQGTPTPPPYLPPLYPSTN